MDDVSATTHIIEINLNKLNNISICHILLHNQYTRRFMSYYLNENVFLVFRFYFMCILSQWGMVLLPVFDETDYIKSIAKCRVVDSMQNFFFIAYKMPFHPYSQSQREL